MQKCCKQTEFGFTWMIITVTKIGVKFKKFQCMVQMVAWVYFSKNG